jgi:DNA-binding NtrC family response regulator
MRGLFDNALRLSKSDVTVLIIGETGTGKSSLAKAIHEQSTRKKRPFVVFDCASVARNLIDSALFGHERGAFTGASRSRVGALETAEDGTIFIDELTELPLELQPKLLRALEERVFVRVGGNKELSVRCRFIAAAQENLVAQVQMQRFRRDLYFRVAAASLLMPALRDRKEDIPELVDSLIEKAGGESGGFARLPETTQERLLRHAWSGNIRELRNVVERLRVDGELTLETIGATVTTPLEASEGGLNLALPYAEFKTRYVTELERTYINALMRRAQGNVSRAAQLGQMNRRYLYRLLEKFGLHGADDPNHGVQQDSLAPKKPQ